MGCLASDPRRLGENICSPQDIAFRFRESKGGADQAIWRGD